MEQSFCIWSSNLIIGVKFPYWSDHNKYGNHKNVSCHTMRCSLKSISMCTSHNKPVKVLLMFVGMFKSSCTSVLFTSVQTNTCVQSILRTTEKLKECVKCNSDLHLGHLFATSCILQLGNLTYLLSKAQSCHLLFISGTGKGFRASADLKDLDSCLQNMPDVCWSQTNHIYISFSFFWPELFCILFINIWGDFKE